MTDRVINAAIEANLSALAEGLAVAAEMAKDGVIAIKANRRNLAIGTVLPLERDLPELAGLLTAILALHRRAGQGGAS